MAGLLHLLQNDWRKTYRHNGGLRPLGRCLSGHRRLTSGGALPRPAAQPKLDCTVFSVVPELSALWAATFERVIGIEPLRVLLGDCSGALRGHSSVCQTVPMLNIHHGEKLDLFFTHLVESDIVLVTDDDIFWLDDAPLRWALDRLAEDDEIAVVSLVPRAVSSVQRGKVEKAMGSVLVIRRDVWRRENLSFRVVQPPPSENVKWHYDTGEFAQVELGRRGYRVEFAPNDLRKDLVFFEGISSWTLKIQKYSGDLRVAVAGVPIRQEKALQTILALRGVGQMIEDLCGQRVDVVRRPWLDRAQGICEQHLSADDSERVRSDVEQLLGRLRLKVMALDAERPLGDAVQNLLRPSGS